MTSLSQIALDFCRDCLGWDDALSLPGHFGQPSVISHQREYCLVFTDLGTVIESIRQWCDKNDASLELAYHGILPGEWEARIVTPVSLEAIVHADPCHALLAACVQAARKVESAAR